MKISAVPTSNALPGPPRVAEHPLGFAVGADGVAHQPGDVGHQVRRPRQPELVAARAAA